MGHGGRDNWHRARARQLQELLARDVQGCIEPSRRGKPAEAMRVRLEATGDEIVDVGVESSDQAVGRCIEERIWSLRLPAEFNRDTTISFKLG